MKIFTIFLTLTLFINAKTINIAVAANASSVIDELISYYKQEHKEISFNKFIGSSGKLSAQIINGAPYDIFLSANKEYPNNLEKRGLGVEKPKIYAKGTLAIFSIKDYNISLNTLSSSQIEKIAIANPKTAPYGEAAKEALQKANLYTKLKPKFIYGQSIGQTLTFTLKAADIGLVAKSQLFSNDLLKYKEGKNWIELDKSLYKPISQAMILLNKDVEVEKFYNFLSSKEAKNIFKKFGYIEE